MINNKEILETINMVKDEHFDVRTITMGISLLSCIRDNAKATADAVYDTICKRAENIVKVGENGEITAVSEGTAEVYCITLDGNFRSSCTVTVYK